MLASNSPRDSLVGLVGPGIDARGESPLVIPPTGTIDPPCLKKRSPR